MAEQWWANDKPAPAAESSENFWANDQPADAKPSGAIRRLADTGISLAKGIIGAPEALVGAADLVTGGRAGKLVESAGVRFKDAKGVLDDMYSPEQKAANQEVQKAEGFFPTIGAMVKNPSTIVNAAVESAPSMLVGGVASRGLLAAAPRMGAISAGALGEGVTAAGQNAEQVRQETEGGLLPDGATLPLLASGAATAGISRASGGLANKLGIGDAQTMLATGKLGPVGADALAANANKGVTRKVAEGFATEGVLQELPQSYQEQVGQNIAQGKPWDEGAAAAGAQGLLAGGLMGGLAGPLGGKESAPPTDPAPAPATPDAPNPQLGFNPNAGTHTVFPDGSVVLNSDTPTGEQAVFDKRYAPQPIKPSEAMGLDPSAGPMSAVAVMAVDGGAHQTEIDKQNQALAQSTQAQSAIENIAPEIQLADIADPYEREHYLSFFDSADKNKGLAAIQANRYLESVLGNDNDIPDFDAASTMSDEDFLRFMGADEQEITNALTQSPTSTQTGTPSAFVNEANVAGDTGQGIGEVQSGQSSQGQVSGQPVDISALPAASSGAGRADASPSMESGMGSGAEDVRALGAGRAADQQNGGVVSPANGADAGAVIEGQANVQEPSTRTQAEPQTQAAPTQAPETATAPAAAPAPGVSTTGLAGVEAAGVATKNSQPKETTNEPQANKAQPVSPQRQEAPAASVASAADEVSQRPESWRRNFIAASKVARGLKIDPKGKKLAALVSEIEAVDSTNGQQKRAQDAIKNVATTLPVQTGPATGPLGRDNTPISEGGKPFKTQAAAAGAKKLQPMMRVVRTDGGFALAEKTPKQLAAEVRAARRLSNPQTSPSGQPIPAHAFIASEGGLRVDTRSDMNIGGNPRIGNRTLFAGLGKGLSIEAATARLIEEGYLPESAGHSEAMALIKRSMRDPQYTAEGTERMAEAEAQARFEDYLNAEQEEPTPDLVDEDAAFLALRGYTEPTAEEQAGIHALMAMAEASGIDNELAMLQAGYAEEQTNNQDYANDYAEIQANEYQPPGSGSRAQTESGTAEQGRQATQRTGAENGVVAAGEESTSEGLTSPTIEEIVSQQDRAAEGKRKEEAENRAHDKAESDRRTRADIAKASEVAADSFELGGDAMENLTGQEPMFSRAKGSAAKKLDMEYMAAVEANDMETAQRLVNESAAASGYSDGTSYRMNHQAPSSDGDFGLVDLRASDIVPADYWTHPHWYATTPEERESHDKVTRLFRVMDKRKEDGRNPELVSMVMYRAVPKDVKDSTFRNGDWITPSLAYAQNEGRMIPDGYRIITARVAAKNLWWDANSIAEMGYDDGNGYAYKNTKNNRKLLDAVTRDDDGAVIPLSRRFDMRNDEARFSRSPATKTAYESRIDALFGDGAKASTVGVRLLDQSDVMGLLGFDKVPLVLNEPHVLHAGLTSHPEMTAAQWKKVPEWIENPAAVYTDPRHPGKLTIVAPVRLAGYPVVIAIEPNKLRGKPDHLLVTAFAKTTGGLPVYGYLSSSGRLRYTDTKKAPEVWRAPGENLRPLRQPSGAKRILTEKNLADYRRENGEAFSFESQVLQRGPSQEDIRKTDELFRAARPKKSTIQDVRKAVNQLVNGLGVLPNKLGRIVVATSEEIESNWVPLIGPVDIKSESEGDAQGFYNPKTRTVFLIADHINQGDEMGVVAHELMHKHGQDVLGKAGWDKLHGTIEGWKSADAASMERQVYDEAASRVKASGAHLSNQELFPYAVQVALEMGVKPNAMAQEGTVARWLAGVRQALRQAWDKITNKPDQFKAQDMVNLAFGIAQMENPDHAPAMQRALDRQNAGAKQAGQRGTNAPVTNPKNVVGNSQGGRSADDSIPGAAKRVIDAGIDFVSQIEILAEKHKRVYIRWSPSAISDLSGSQTSRDFQSGAVHPGLSAIEITGDMHPVDIADRLSEYGFLRMQDRRSTPHVFLADRVGTDSDGYASIKPKKLLLDSDSAIVKAIDLKLSDIMDAMDNIERESEKLKTSPGHPAVMARLNSAKEKLDKLLPNESTAPDSGGAAFARGNKSTQGTTADRAVMDMVREGRTAQDILQLIAGTSRSRFNKQVARLLLKTGVAPAVEMGGDLGGGGGFKFLAKYSPSEDVVTMTEGAQGQAEQIFMHEMVHAATIQALNRKGLASVQMRKLFEHVKKQGGAAGQYGMKNVREFASEAFTNPDFQRALKTMSAPSGSSFKTSWDGFVRIMRGILGLPQDSTNALSRALDLGVAVMREDMALRERGAARRGDQAGGAVAGDEDANFGEAVREKLEQRGEHTPGKTGRQYTPEQMSAMKNVGLSVETPSLKDRAQALWKDAGKKLAQGIADQFAPVRDMDKDAYTLLRLSKGASGAFESFLHGGMLKLTDKVYDFDDTKRGGVVDKLLKPLGGEHHDFFRWIAANRAEKLTSQGKENLFTLEDIAALKTLADGQTSFDYTIQNGIRKGRTTRDRAVVYADSLVTFNAFNKNILDLSEQSGLIDPESRKVWESEFYVPFYRVSDEADGGVRGMNVKGSVVRQQAFKQLKGGKDKLNADLLDNTLMNWAHLLDASAKNRAAKATLEAAEAMGVAISAPEAAVREIGKSTGNKSGVVWFMDGGQKRHYVIDGTEAPMLLTAITALEYAGMRNPAMNAMGAFKHALTVGVTASPYFKIRNLIRDSVQVIASGPIGFNPVANVAQGWKLTDPKSDAYFRLLAGGGTIHFGTMMEGSEGRRVQSLVDSGVSQASILDSDEKVKAFYRKFIKPSITAYNELGDRGEAINRAALYDQLVKQGVSHAEASIQARDLMDFSMQGSFTSVRFLTQVVPFMNARIQGLYKLGKAAKEDPKRFAAVLGATAMFSLALLAAYSDDDDWKKREEWDRNNFWWFKFGGTAFRIPKPFEIGAIGTLAERGFELAFDKEMTNKRFMNQVMTLLGDNLSMNPVPQLVKPVIDMYANKDSFSGRPIETMGMEKLQPEYRFTNRTSMVARGVSTAANAVTGMVGVNAPSPVQVDHLLRSYFGWLGSFVVGVADVLARPATDQPGNAAPDYWKTATNNIASSLDGASSRYVSQMYDQAKEIEQAYGTWRALLKEGKTDEAQSFMEANKTEISKHKFIERVKKSAALLNQQIKHIERSDMPGDEKRAKIIRLREQQDRVARQVA